MGSGPSEVHRDAIVPGEIVVRPSAEREAGPALGAVLGAVSARPAAGPSQHLLSQLDRFLQERTLGGALRIWLGTALPRDKETLAVRLNRDVAYLDALVNEQVNAVLHHPQFQRLEASWRGLRYLVDRAEEEEDRRVKIRVLSVTWKELERDFERAAEFDASQLFRKVYEQEFGMPGGEPFGLLVGDYEIHPRPSPDHPHDDIQILKAISQVAAAAFCPFVASAHPSLFGLDSFATLDYRLDHAATFEHKEYVTWRALRDSEDARFLGLTLPRVLMRAPYEDDGTRVDAFRFREEVSGPDGSKYLWGSAAYAFAGVVIRAFARSGWLADIRGVQRGVEGGGLVGSLPVHRFGTDRRGLAARKSTEIVITDELERDLAELGFLPLGDCQDTDYAAFYSSQSLQRPKKYDRLAATLNARMSSLLQYMLCVSRFAHYVKVMGRDKVGTFGEPQEFEQFLQDWITRYVTPDAEAPPEVRARFPLREAQVRVRAQPGKPGSFECVMHLAPHYELDELTAAVRVRTELAPPRMA